MRPTEISKGAAGYSAWVPTDWRPHGDASIGVTLTDSASLTYSVEYTLDNPNAPGVQVTWSRSTTTATITWTDHGFTVGDSVVLYGGSEDNLKGTFAVASVTSANAFTVTVSNTGGTSGAVFAIKQRIFTLVSGKTASLNTDITYPIAAVRLYITTYASGTATLRYLHHTKG